MFINSSSGFIIEMAKNLQLRGYKEVTIDNYRFDVVWRKRADSCPFAVFEISSVRDISIAVARLRAARIKFGNPLLYLVIEKEDIEKAQQIIANSFAELLNQLKVLTTKDILTYSKLLSQYDDMMGRIFPEKPTLWFRRK